MRTQNTERRTQNTEYRIQNFCIYAFTHIRGHAFADIPIYIFFILLLFLGCFGCEQPTRSIEPTTATEPADVGLGIFITDSFAPSKIDIMPLTAITTTADGRLASLDAYVSLVDSFDCQQKWPAVFRLELYERVFRAAEQKGKRVCIWPDIDLMDAAVNNNYWKDFLGTYQFTLNFEPAGGTDYVLLVTCLLPNQKRISAELTLKAVQRPEQK